MDEEALINFASITGADMDTARHFMEASNWQIDQAVELFFANPSVPQSSVQHHQPPQQHHLDPYQSESMFEAPSRNQYGVMDEEEIRPAMDQHVSRLFGDDSPTPPMNPTGRSGFSANLPSFITDRLPGIFGGVRRQDQPQQRIQSPQNELTKGSDQFRKMFAPPKNLLFNGSFQAAQNEAIQEKKWLLINIQADDIFDCHKLNRDTWGNDLVQTIVGAFFVFWQVEKSSGEGARFNSLYHVVDYPYIAVIDPRTGENMKHWVGFMDAQKTCDELQKFCDSNSMDDGFIPTPQEFNNDPIPNTERSSQPAPSFTTPMQQQQSAPIVQDDDTEDQLLRQAIAESLKQSGSSTSSHNVPSSSVPNREKTEDELLQEAIQASLEGHKMQDDDDDDEILKQIQEQSQREHEEQLQKKQQEEEASKKSQAPELTYMSQVDQFVISDQDKTTDSSLVTRLQLRLPSGKRDVFKVRKATPLIVFYALVRQKLAADENKDVSEVPAFTIVNVNKPLENVSDKTLADANALGSSLMVTFD